MTFGSPLSTPLPAFAAIGTILRTASGTFGFGAGVGVGGTGVGAGGTGVGAEGTGVLATAAGDWAGAVVGAGVEASHATTNRPTTNHTNILLLKLIVVSLLLKERVGSNHAASGSKNPAKPITSLRGIMSW